MEDKKRISVAKRLLKELLNRIKPKQKYEKVILDIAAEARKEIVQSYSFDDKVFGVFSKYATFKSLNRTEEGKKLIQKIANSLCKNFKKAVITGDRLYYYKDGKVKTQTVLITQIEKKSKEEDRALWRTTFSKILGHIPDNAIFLIDPERTASIHEEGSFHSRIRNGVGVIIPHKIVKMCKKSAKIEINKLQYYRCLSDNFEYCAKKSSGCIAKRLKINATTLEPFINKETHKLIIVYNLEKIEKIITQAVMFD